MDFKSGFGRFFIIEMFINIAILVFTAGFVVSSHFPPWESWHNEAPSFLALFLISCSVLRRVLKERRSVIEIPFLALLPILVVAIAIIQMMTGLLFYTGELLVIFLYMSLCMQGLIVGFLASRQMGDIDDLKTIPESLGWALLFAALTSTFIVLAQSTCMDLYSAIILSTENYANPGAHLGQRNHIATLGVMGIVSCIYLQSQKKISSILAYLLLLVIGVGLIATQSRTGMLSLLFVIIWLIAKCKINRSSKNITTFILILIIALFQFWPTFMNKLHIIHGVNAIKMRDLNDVRMQIWQSLWSAVLERPWFGWGINHTSIAHNAIAHAQPNVGAAFTYSHNLFLDMAIWIGLPITILLAIYSIIWLYFRLKSTQSDISWLGVGIILPFMAHSMLEYPFAYAYFLFPVSIYLGMIEGSLNKKTIRICYEFFLLLVFITGIALTWSVVDYIKAEEKYRTARFEMLHIGQDKSAKNELDFIALNQLGGLINGINRPITKSMSNKDIDSLRDLALMYPSSPMPYRYILALALNGGQKEAFRQLDVIYAQNEIKYSLSVCNNLIVELKSQGVNWPNNCDSVKPN
ncbi:MAG: Wzy polymerase domain-containing protein [Brachymonas sp.]